MLIMRNLVLLTALMLLIANAATARTPDGGGHLPMEPTECISAEEHGEIWTRLQASMATLKSLGRLPDIQSTTVTKLDWPIRAAEGHNDYGYTAISFYVDHNPTTGERLDYNCGTRTYDTPSGYQHPGTDIFPWPFWWYAMENNIVTVVAAAAGTIISKDDGNFDRSCVNNSNRWNAVYVRHDDGSIAWYGHLKLNSLTSKAVGERVEQGEFLGVIGSSGNSSGPHLHFEIMDDEGNVIDPYQGDCNSFNSTSWWNEQEPYHNSQINKLATHSAEPVFPACPEPERPNYKNNFQAGEEIVYGAYFRDQLRQQLTAYSVLRPDGSVFDSWPHSSLSTHRARSFWTWNRRIPVDAPHGVWTFQAEYLGKTYRHNFTVGDVTSIAEAQQESLPAVAISPNPVKAETRIHISPISQAIVSIELYNSLGRHIKTILSPTIHNGPVEARWDGCDISGARAAPGLYWCHIRIDQQAPLIKALLLQN